MIVIRAMGFANGTPCPHVGQYVESFDHEAHDGRGYATFTSDLAKAMKFKQHGDAFEFWRKVPNNKKKRPDGKPNRPFTALSVEIIDEAKAAVLPPITVPEGSQ